MTLHKRFNPSKCSITCHLGTEWQAEGLAWSPQSILAFVIVTIRSATFIIPALTMGGHLAKFCACKMTHGLCQWWGQVNRQLQVSGTLAFIPVLLQMVFKQLHHVTRAWNGG